MAKETYNYGLTDLDGKPVPDSSLSPTGRDLLDSTGDWNTDIKKGVGAYFDDKRIPLASVDKKKYIVKFIAGLWRLREKPEHTYTITQVYDKKLILGPEIKINERDEFKFTYYTASEVKYDLFGVLVPNFKLYVAKCNTVHGPMLRYGETRPDARAFLRGAIMDDFGPDIALVVLGKKKSR